MRGGGRVLHWYTFISRHLRARLRYAAGPAILFILGVRVVLRIKEASMSYRALAILVTALSAAQVTAADAQTVYVAPGGVYVGAGPVYVTPAPANPVGPYGPPPPYAPPTYVAPPYAAPAPAYEVAPPLYDETQGVYVRPYEAYGSRRPAYVGRARIYGSPADYGAQTPPRPPAAVPNRSAWCTFNGRWEYCR